MLALKYLAPTLVLFNVKKLLGQSQETGIKPNVGDSIIFYF